jgi:hypothetical protein
MKRSLRVDYVKGLARTDSLEGFTRIKDDLESTLRSWKRKLVDMHDENYKAAHLQGKQLKEFYTVLRKKQPIPAKFEHINEDGTLHMKLLEGLTEAMAKDETPVNCLGVVRKYFELLKERSMLQEGEEMEDRMEEFIHFNKMPAQEVDFLRGITYIGKARLHNLKFHHIMVCSQDTSKEEISSIINRALRDPDSEYALLGYQLLGRQKQQYMVDFIREYRQSLSP